MQKIIEEFVLMPVTICSRPLLSNFVSTNQSEDST